MDKRQPVGRISGNEQYFREIEREMMKEVMTPKEAELRLLWRVIFRMRIDKKLTHNAIAAILSERYGFSYDTYYRRLREIRKKKPVP